jgi:hypothetical protein
MGRGDRKRVRWAHDRERKHKQRAVARQAERTAERKSSKKGA